MDNITFVGLDVHKATVCVAVAEDGRDGEVRQVGVFENRADVLNKMVARLSKKGRRLSFCYEAGPCGYGLQRLLTNAGHECVVVAPSLIPIKAGDRVKTDRRDATMLAKLHRAGELTAVWVPDQAHEAMRDLVRARATAVRVLGKARQHLQGFLLRHVPLMDIYFYVRRLSDSLNCANRPICSIFPLTLRISTAFGHDRLNDLTTALAIWRTSSSYRQRIGGHSGALG